MIRKRKKYNIHAFSGGGIDVRFLIDECTGFTVAKWLRSLQHEIFSVYDFETVDRRFF